MKKETRWYILLLIVVIFTCVFIGNHKIFEGMPMVSANNSSDIFPSELEDLDDTKKILTNKTGEKVGLDSDSSNNQITIKFFEDQAAEAKRKAKIVEAEAAVLLQKKIENSVIASAVYLPLYNNAKNESYGKFNDPSNKTEYAARNMKGENTSLNFTTFNGRKCVKFNNATKNYISFPINYADQFSFSFWVYIDTTDQNNKYTIASITNSQTLNPSLEVELEGNYITVKCALASNNPWSVTRQYSGLTTGWTFVAFAYDSKKQNTTSLYINKDLVSESIGFGKFMQNDLFSTPDVFILGRSGSTFSRSEYTGHICDFYYYIFTLTPDSALKMYCRNNNNTTDVKCV